MYVVFNRTATQYKCNAIKSTRLYGSDNKV